MMERPLENDMLRGLFAVYEEWTARYAFACRKGCSTCCTQSVAMTTLEGREVMAFLAECGLWSQYAKMLEACHPKAIPVQTTNQFAESCLAQRELDSDQEAVWDFSPCIFLGDDLCMIYPVRPFGCRGFVSLQSCRENGSAEMEPLLITVNTMMLQIIEHLDSKGGLFGNMAGILRFLGSGTADGLLSARPNPGFLVPPEETADAAAFLERGNSFAIHNTTMGRLLAECGAYGGRKCC